MDKLDNGTDERSLTQAHELEQKLIHLATSIGVPQHINEEAPYMLPSFTTKTGWNIRFKFGGIESRIEWQVERMYAAIARGTGLHPYDEYNMTLEAMETLEENIEALLTSEASSDLIEQIHEQYGTEGAAALFFDHTLIVPDVVGFVTDGVKDILTHPDAIWWAMKIVLTTGSGRRDVTGRDDHFWLMDSIVKNGSIYELLDYYLSMPEFLKRACDVEPYLKYLQTRGGDWAVYGHEGISYLKLVAWNEMKEEE